LPLRLGMRPKGLYVLPSREDISGQLAERTVEFCVVVGIFGHHGNTTCSGILFMICNTITIDTTSSQRKLAS